MLKEKITVKEGDYGVMGAVCDKDSVTFTVQCDKESSCVIRIYDEKDDTFTDFAIPENYCMGAVKSITLDGFNCKGYAYNLVIDGREIIDPYAKSVLGREKWGVEHEKVRGGFYISDFDWEDDVFPEIDRTKLFIYKLHVRGLSKDKSSPAKAKGTFEGIIESIDYLKSLGVTAVELMPIYEFEETPVRRVDTKAWNPQAAEGFSDLSGNTSERVRLNYWGYGKGNYFAVKKSYAKSSNASDEFKRLVKALHKNGIEVILEMSFNGLGNPGYGVYVLRHWVKNYHIDGFHILSDYLPIETLTEDPYLARTKIFYHSYPEYIWNSDYKIKRLFIYNDDYSYVLRKQINHQDSNTLDFISTMGRNHDKIGFVNYIANNNGFTLADIFSYVVKHNDDNGENNSDGNDWNYSTNMGVEGETKKKAVLAARENRMKMAAASVLLSRGVPLIYAGDEFGNSQYGNNNAYCQDNKVGWVSWNLGKKYSDYVDAFKKLVEIRNIYSVLTSEGALKGEDYKALGLPDVSFHDIHPWTMNLYPSLMMVGLLLNGQYAGSEEDVYLGFNFSSASTSLALTDRENYGQWKSVYGSDRLEDDRVIVDGESVTILVRKKLTEAEIKAKKEAEAVIASKKNSIKSKKRK